MSAPGPQHAVNAVVATAPFASFWAHFPDFITGVVGVLATIYYLIWIAKEIRNWRRHHTEE